MAKKQYTPEEFKAKTEKSAANKENFSKVFLSSIAVMLALVITFSVVSIAFTFVGKAGQTTVVSGAVNNDGSTNVPNDNTSDVPSDNVADVPSDEDATDAPEDDATVPGDDNTADAPSNEANADQQALDMFKKAVAAARTKSKSVVRVKDGAINYKGVVRAGGLSSIAESLMGMFMVPDADSIEVTNAEWKAEDLPPAGAQSNLTAAGVKSAEIVEEGDYFIVTIVANNASNPKAGDDGVGSISSVIEEGQITGAIGSVPGLELNNISIDYEEVTAIATIDKTTGYMVALTTSSPCYLNLDAKVPLLGSIDDACVGIQVISEFTVSY